MKNKYFIPVIFIVLTNTFYSCTDRGRDMGSLSFSVINRSKTDIKITFGNPEKLYVHYPFEDGIKRGLEGPITGFTSFKNSTVKAPRFGFSSSLKVIFNDKDTVYHYNDSLAHVGKYFNKTSNRCLYNLDSYTIEKTKKGENANYTFTEEDYHFAQGK